ncbi:MFS general substrate transporter [Gonapodya prolifera JEL478]|uniref:MFS general substrate transporter n=1 Tax=Gonapodya prolifera (strain JEL478) TaxID=1344416 RepID=A0A139A973_GONPJ|nr:MFS general substrate transporter [Gonapodya prolifera JEL478]|eukprot:KXS13316.1 MFS general substrate transporter [Gonapodya prolifera JEL478]
MSNFTTAADTDQDLEKKAVLVLDINLTESAKLDLEEQKNDQKLPFTTLVTVLSLSLIMAIATLCSTLVAQMLPTIARELDGQSNYAWVGTGYLLSSTALSPAWGSLSDISLLRNSESTPASWVLLSDPQPPSGPESELSIPSLIHDPLTVKPLIGGLIVDNLGWRWGFYIVLPFAGLALVGAIFGVKVSHPKGTFREQILRVDYLGFALLTGACIALLLALSWGGNTYGWASAEEGRYAREPIVPLELFKSWNYVVSVTSLFFVGWAIYGLSYFIPTVRGMSATDSGVNNLPFTAFPRANATCPSVFMIVFSLVAGIFVAHTGQYRFISAIGLALLAIGVAVFYIWDTGSPAVVYIAPQLVAGAGAGFVTNVGQMVAQTSAPKKLNGPASTIANFGRLVGGAIGIAVFQTIFSNILKSKVPGYFTAVAIQYRLKPEQLALFNSFLNNRFSAQRTDISSIPSDALAALGGAYKQATVDWLRLLFISGAAVVAVGAGLALFVRHVPLRKTLKDEDES